MNIVFSPTVVESRMEAVSPAAQTRRTTESPQFYIAFSIQQHRRNVRIKVDRKTTLAIIFTLVHSAAT